MQLQLLVLLILSVSVSCSLLNWSNRKSLFNNIDPDVKEDASLNNIDLLRKYGYPAELHRITTEDGYILELHRIPRPRAVPVLLVHGLVDGSDTWVIMGPDKGFAYMLSDLKYDVWMANVRGNIYSKKHITLSPQNAKFWNFTFHEIGIIDIPTTIDYVLRKTNFKRLHYIGHSQGCTGFFIMCSQLPRYNNKIISMQALAPAVFLKGSKSPLVKFFTDFQFQLGNIAEVIGYNEFLPSSQFLKFLAQRICKDGSLKQSLCSDFLFLTVGPNEDQMNSTMLPVIYGHYPVGASTKQIKHFSQFFVSNRFRQFDYGSKGNLQKYKTASPPEYDLRKVTAKVAIYYGTNDWATVPQGVEKLSRALPNVIEKYLVHGFNHIDFVWGKDAREMVYKKVTSVMKLVEKGRL